MHFLEKERFYSSQQWNKSEGSRLQTDTILVSVLIKTLVLFVSPGPYLLSRATHLSLFPLWLSLSPCLRMLKVQASGRGRVRGPCGCPGVSFTLRVSVALRLRLRPRHKHRTIENGHLVIECILLELVLAQNAWSVIIRIGFYWPQRAANFRRTSWMKSHIYWLSNATKIGNGHSATRGETFLFRHKLYMCTLYISIQTQN